MSTAATVEIRSDVPPPPLEAPRPRRRRLKPAIRRLEIIVAAAKVMRRHGSATTIEDVAREAGAARGTVYLYFPTWEALVLELRRLVLAEFELRAAPLVAHAPDDWPLRTQQLSFALVDYLVGLGGLRDGLFCAPNVPRLSARDASAPIVELLRAGVKAGQLAPDDPDSTGRLIGAAAHATADAIAAGEPRERALAALGDLARRAVTR